MARTTPRKRLHRMRKRADSPALLRQMRAKQMSVVFRQARVVNFITPLNAALTAGVLWGSASHGWLFAWVATLTALAGVRAVFFRLYTRRRPDHARDPVWRRTFLALLFAVALIWGGGLYAFFPQTGLLGQVFVILVALGMGAGAISAYAQHLPSMFAFLAPATLPVSVALFRHPTPELAVLGVMGIIFFAALAALGVTINRNFVASLRLASENRGLARGLRATRAHLSDALEAVPLGLMLFDPDARLVLWNSRAPKFFPVPSTAFVAGYRYEDMVRDMAASDTIAGARSRFEAWIAEQMAWHRNPEEPREVTFTDGRVFQAIERRTSDGSTVCVRIDISRTRHDENVLAQTSSLLDAVLDSIQEGLMVLDPRLRLIQVNERYREMLGMPETLLKPGTPMEEMVEYLKSRGEYVVGDATAKIDALQSAMRKGRAFSYERTRPNGSVLLIRNNPMKDGGWTTTFADVTAERRAAAALRESEERYRLLVETSPDIILVHTGGRIAFINHVGARQLGFAAPADAIGRCVLDFVAPKDRDTLRDISLRGNMGAPFPFAEFTMQRADGSAFEAEAGGLAFRFNGEPAVQIIARDITERKHTQAQLIQSSKLATLGEMAAGMAHELNQPLNIIRMSADNALYVMDEEGPAAGAGDDAGEDAHTTRDQLVLIRDQTQRMAEIINHMRVFSRRDDTEREIFDPFACTRRSITLIEEQFRFDDIRFETDIAVTPAQVLGHPIRLEQVILGLLANARDAILSRREDDARGRMPGNILVTGEFDGGGAERGGGVVRIRVADDGCGIAAENMGRIFDPFFTTKRAGRGTGLGLSIGYGIVDAMGGRIVARNRAQGAEFEIILPAA